MTADCTEISIRFIALVQIICRRAPICEHRLATSDAATAKASGRHWHHRQQREAAAENSDPGFQDALVEKLAELTGVHLFEERGEGAGPAGCRALPTVFFGMPPSSPLDRMS